MNWYIEVLKKYAVFSGRARRKEYWFFSLFNIIIYIALSIIDYNTGTFEVDSCMGLSGSIYSFLTLIPNITVSVRRLHDTGRSGWWFLIWLAPLFNLCLLVFMMQDSKPGENQYGPNPKIAVNQKKIDISGPATCS